MTTTKGLWSKKEEERLRKLWPSTPVSIVAHRLKRTERSTRRKAARLGLGPNPHEKAKHRLWTNDEKELLSTQWGSVPPQTLATTMGRSRRAIADMARKLGLPPLREAQGSTSVAALARHIGCGTRTVLLAAESLRMRLRRGKKTTGRGDGQRYAITEKQQERLIEYIVSRPAVFADKKGSARTTAGRWGVGMKPDACVRCNRNTVPHERRGLCSTCARKERTPSARKRTLDYRYATRRMRKKDIDVICAPDLAVGWLQERGARASLSTTIDMREPAFVRLYDKRVVGYIVGELTIDTARISSLSVRRGARRRGHGRALMDAFLGAIADRTVLLSVHVSNDGAQALYREYGFEVVGRAPDFYGAGEDSYEMALIHRARFG